MLTKRRTVKVRQVVTVTVDIDRWNNEYRADESGPQIRDAVRHQLTEILLHGYGLFLDPTWPVVSVEIDGQGLTPSH